MPKSGCTLRLPACMYARYWSERGSTGSPETSRLKAWSAGKTAHEPIRGGAAGAGGAGGKGGVGTGAGSCPAVGTGAGSGTGGAGGNARGPPHAASAISKQASGCRFVVIRVKQTGTL